MSSFYEWTVEPFTWHTDKKGLYVIDNDFSVKFRDEHKQWFSFIILKGAKTVRLINLFTLKSSSLRHQMLHLEPFAAIVYWSHNILPIINIMLR